MSSHYTVAPGYEFSYPADPVSERIIKDVGGRSHLSGEQKKLVKYKVAKEGEDCGDLPSHILTLYLSRGWVIDTSVIEKTPIIEEVETDEGDV